MHAGGQGFEPLILHQGESSKRYEPRKLNNEYHRNEKDEIEKLSKGKSFPKVRVTISTEKPEKAIY